MIKPVTKSSDKNFATYSESSCPGLSNAFLRTKIGLVVWQIAGGGGRPHPKGGIVQKYLNGTRVISMAVGNFGKPKENYLRWGRKLSNRSFQKLSVVVKRTGSVRKLISLASAHHDQHSLFPKVNVGPKACPSVVWAGMGGAYFTFHPSPAPV